MISKRFPYAALSILLCVLASAPSEARTAKAKPAPAAISLKKVVVALKPDKNPEAMLAERQALADFLGKRLGKPVDVIVPLSANVILEGFGNGTVDLGFLSGMDMVNARKADLATILLAVDFDGKTSYSSFWVSLKDKPYASVADLKSKPIAFASRTSTSGYLIPHADLVKKGLLKEAQDPEAFFGKGNVFYGTGYVSAVEQVLRGRAEGAAVSDYVVQTDRYLSPDQKARLKVVQSQGPVPTHVLAGRKSLSADDRGILREAFEAMNQPSNTSLRDKLFNDHLKAVESDEAHLRSLDEALKLTGKTL